MIEITIALVVLGVLVIVLIAIYNRLVVTRMRIRESWSNVDTELKRRHDLVPNLVATVQGYAQHERALFDEVTRLRTQLRTEPDPDACRREDEDHLARTLGRILAVAEAYPDLKASASFVKLQHQLAETEDRIQAARRFFNANVRDHNNLVEQFPSFLVARAFKFGTQPYFELATVAERAAPSAL